MAQVADNVVAVSLETIRWFDSHLEKVYQTNAPQLENVHRKNALRLFESRGIKLFISRVPDKSLTYEFERM